MQIREKILISNYGWVKVFACRCTCGTIKICFRVHRFVIKLNLKSLSSFDEDYVLQLPLDCPLKRQTLSGKRELEARWLLRGQLVFHHLKPHALARWLASPHQYDILPYSVDHPFVQVGSSLRLLLPNVMHVHCKCKNHQSKP